MASCKANPIDAVKKFFELATSAGFGRVLGKLQILCAEKGICMAEMKVDEDQKNFRGNLHGGFTAALIASMSTFSLLADGAETPGVSVNLNVTYPKPAQPGDELIVVAKTNKRGKNLGYVSVVITNKSTGHVVATGSLSKLMGK